MTLNTFDPSGLEHSKQGKKSDRHSGLAAFFGRETAYVTGLYLRQAFIFTGIILTIVLALDVVGRMSRVLELSDDPTGFNGIFALAYYVGLRAAFVSPSVFPIAAIIGVMWAEFSLSRSNERIMIFCSGRAPVRSLMPALIFGIIVGLIQFGTINFSRPYSTELQAVSKYRFYGPRYVSSSIPKAKWFVTEDTIFNAKIAFGPPVVLQDVKAYRISSSGLMEAIISADQATSNSDGKSWEFSNGTIREFTWEDGDGGSPKTASETTFKSRSIPVSLDPLWAEYIDVKPHLLPFKVLHNLGVAKSGIPNSVAFKAAYQQRYAAALACIAMALLAASLSLLLFSPQMALTKMVQVVAIGYTVHVGSTVLRLLGQHGLLPLPFAVWMLPISIIIGAYALLYWKDRRIRADIAEQVRRDNVVLLDKSMT